MVAELHELLSVERPRVSEAISEARDKGDLSENFEYHAAKREQGKLEGRIDRLKVKLTNARIIDRNRLTSDAVQLFSTVKLTDLTRNREMKYTIVNPMEADFSTGKISIKTPIGQGLLKKRVGDIVEIKVPAGMLKLRIDDISIMQNLHSPFHFRQKCVNTQKYLKLYIAIPYLSDSNNKKWVQHEPKEDLCDLNDLLTDMMIRSK